MLPLRFSALACAGALIAGSPALAAPAASLPLALRGVDPNMLSGGLFLSLDAGGAFGARPVARARAGVPDLSKGKPPAVLDARVGANIRLGNDPAALPDPQRGQAEPHIFRSAADPNLLLGTFQEGRFTDGGGSLDCGYSISRDGGLTWTRALIPQLTTTSGGPYLRATDPVAAIGPQGDLYLNTLGSIDNAFGLAALVVSRSTDSGTSWSAPIVIFQSATTQVMPDKNWFAVNDFPGTPNSGRLVATWTNFTSNAAGNSTGNNIVASVSDDRGASWTAPIPITPAGTSNQGSQAMFLPDGSLAVVYITFITSTTQFSIQCKRSTDGGRTYPGGASSVAGFVAAWDDPDMRDGVFLPSATVSRTSGEIFVTYTAVVGGSPRVLFTKSSDQGTTWSAPVIASDNPAGVSVMNPALSVTPDGRTVSIVFMDKRNAPDGHNFVDHYAALSFDGGATWQPNVRLTEMSSDIRYGTPTSRGIMLGDYLGIAPSLASDQPCVAIWCDTRTGNADPFTVRFAPSATADFTAWGLAHGASTSPQADSDFDGELNLLEYGNGTDPLGKESGESLYVANSAAGTLDVAWTQRAAPLAESRIGGAVVAINPDLAKFVRFAKTQLQSDFTFASGVTLPADQLPKVTPRPGLAWTGLRFTVPAGSMVAAARTVLITNGQGQVVDGAVVPFNTDSRLINLSTRGRVGLDASQMIVGFVLDGPKTILVRAAGPALATFGVSGFLPDPRLLLTSTSPSAFAPAANDNWQQGGATANLFTRLGAFPFGANSLDAALVVPLSAQPYTAIVSGANASTGVALVEAYDADATPGAPGGSRLINLSTRGDAGTGDNTLVAGVVIRGTQPRRVLIRVVGPSLANFGVTTALSDPVLTLYQGSTQIATNDDWEISRSGAAIAATAQRVGAFPLNAASLDAALLVTLAPGPYTAIVSSADGSAGIALVEVYDVD